MRRDTTLHPSISFVSSPAIAARIVGADKPVDFISLGIDGKHTPSWSACNEIAQNTIHSLDVNLFICWSMRCSSCTKELCSDVRKLRVLPLNIVIMLPTYKANIPLS